MRLHRGFSLIELLVVVALIGILTAMASVAYSTIQKKSRDSRRTSDMKAVQHGLEQYFTDNNATYPEGCDSTGTLYLPDGMPKDPKTQLAYSSQICTSDWYCVCATLETGSGNATADCNGLEGTFYCIHPMQ